MSEPGGRMYRDVFEYAALGEHHRTGTPEDAATLDWFEAKLRALGAEVERQPWTFDRYDASWSLTAAGVPVEALPLFYEGVGEVDTGRPFITTLEPQRGAGLPGFADRAARAAADGYEAAILLTAGRGGRLAAVNRAPVMGSGLPTLCAGAGARDLLESGPVRLRLSARVVPGKSANVVARFGPGPDERRLLLTTPLSGWFRCAGERGTGIAVMLAVAEALAAEGVPLLVTGNSGHELEDYGAHRFAEGGLPRPRSVFHFGASVAAGEPDGHGGLRLTSGVAVRACAPGREQPLRKAFRPLGLKPTWIAGEEPAGESWVGEARVWSRFERPLVSMAGFSPLFHTPADTPARATSPVLLEASFAAALDACRVLAHA